VLVMIERRRTDRDDIEIFGRKHLVVARVSTRRREILRFAEWFQFALMDIRGRNQFDSAVRVITAGMTRLELLVTELFLVVKA
jgi:hypothetical protein